MTQDDVFVTPHYADHRRAAGFLNEMVRSIEAQTDPHWRLIIVDDKSPDPSAVERLRAIQARDPQRIQCIFMPEHVGQGVCRNVGVNWAKRIGAAFVLFNDADDVSYPDRLERVRSEFERDPDVGLVYSTFEVIDEDGVQVERHRLGEPIRQILDAQSANAPRGYDAWKRIGTETGYANLTSTTAVRTAVAIEYPFFCMTAEDSNAWYRMSGGGVKFSYVEAPLAKYRIPTDIKGSQDRARVGESYYFGKMIAEIAGFFAATDMATGRGEIDSQEARQLEKDFFLRLSRTLRAEGAHSLADRVSSRASDGVELAQNVRKARS
ncbi:MAG TPA: glycosyltransferase [Steroidobacteraceae bacterium]